MNFSLKLPLILAHYFRSITFMYANVAVVAKTIEKITRFPIMFIVKVGLPKRKDLIKSAPLLKGLSSANATNGKGMIPS